MSRPGLDLVLWVVADQLADRPCGHCGQALAGARLALREQRAESMVVSATCRGCGTGALLKVEPEAEDGVARLR